MRKYLFLTMLVVTVFCVSLSGVAAAQQETAAQKGEESFYSYGNVVSVENGVLTIDEDVYNDATGEESVQRVVYTVGPELELENANTIQDLKAGAEVDVEYVEKDGKRKAVYIYVYSAETV